MQRNRYEMLTDENLIEELRGGDSAITDFIMNKYKPMVRKKARAMFLLGGENEDLIQEGMIGLFKAIRDYDQAGNILCKLCRTVCLKADVQCDRGISEKEAPSAEFVCFIVRRIRGGGKEGSSDRYH